MSSTKGKVSAIHYPHRLSRRRAVEKTDALEILDLHSHRSAASFGADLRSLRTSPQPKGQSFGTRLADVLVASLPVPVSLSAR